MKKTISIILILAIAITFFLTGNTYADSLDTINVDIDKTTVRPGEETKITINFGQQLGSYTFDIAYDNNIFEYVSVDGGTANDTTDKVRVTFYDSTGGTSPRENMSIIFKAKEGITTSNPTEFSITAEGLANPDASVTYDDITTPIIENVTVEPEYQDYEINLQYTGDIIAGEEKEMTLSYTSSMGRYYEHARLIAEATTPSGASVKLTGTNTDEQTEQDIIQSGWGDPQGYKIGGKDVSQILNVRALFSDVGNYTITLKLIDRDNSDAVIAQKEFQFTATEKQVETPEINPPETNQPESNGQGNQEPSTTQPSENNQQEVTEKPTTLPKTGNNIYIPIAVIIIFLAGVGVYYNRKK